MNALPWQTFASIAAIVGIVASGFYRLGSVSRQVNRNERDIGTIYKKLDDIYLYVKNGRK